MNLHVTNDTYGLYTVEIAERIGHSAFKDNNIIVNISVDVQLTHESVEYIPETTESFRKYISKLPPISKVSFHPYNFTSYEFLQELLVKFPAVEVYWIGWSYEYYNLPHVVHKLYDPFSSKYIRSKSTLQERVKQSLVNGAIHIRGWAGIKKNYRQKLKHASSLVHYFYSPFPTDFYNLNRIIPKNNIRYRPLAYLSLDRIMPGLDNYRSVGNKIMIGHASSPDGNHFEVIEKISAINSEYPVLLPLVYGDTTYGTLIRDKAISVFKNVEILETKLEKTAYYQKLCEVGWAVINVKVQQAIGNIMGLVWMGAKVFLDKDTSTYIDFVKWGIVVFSIQDDLNKKELETPLTPVQVESNKRIILEQFSEERLNEQWKNILS